MVVEDGNSFFFSLLTLGVFDTRSRFPGELRYLSFTSSKILLGPSIGMNRFELLIPRRPVSHQTTNRKHLAEWMNLVFSRAFHSWVGLPVAHEKLRFILVFISESDPADINNLIKPIQDALIGVVYTDDGLVVDVQGHVRMVDEALDITHLPDLLQDAILNSADCVYIRVENSFELHDLL